MLDLEILKQNRPDVAAFVQKWGMKYNRPFNLNDEKDQADFYEAFVEMAKHVAVASESATLTLNVCVTGVSGLTLFAKPKPEIFSSP